MPKSAEPEIFGNTLLTALLLVRRLQDPKIGKQVHWLAKEQASFPKRK
jgi:hypothetical protein